MGEHADPFEVCATGPTVSQTISISSRFAEAFSTALSCGLGHKSPVQSIPRRPYQPPYSFGLHAPHPDLCLRWVPPYPWGGGGGRVGLWPVGGWVLGNLAQSAYSPPRGGGWGGQLGWVGGLPGPEAAPEGPPAPPPPPVGKQRSAPVAQIPKLGVC